MQIKLLLSKIGLSIISLIGYLIFFIGIVLLPNPIKYGLLYHHLILLRVIYLILQFFPFVVIAIGIIEIVLREKIVQAWISIVLAVGMYIVIYFLLNPLPKKKLSHVYVGHISFESNGQKDGKQYQCNYSFGAEVDVEAGSNKLVNEIISKKQNILQTIDSNSKSNCTENDLEEYLNKDCKDIINKKLDNGEIEKITLDSLQSSIQLTSSEY